ncbi:MAG: sigma-70 family RNA polymerase sigma factor [Terriglobales bacterium]
MGVRAPASQPSPAQADERLLVEAAQKDPSRFADLYELHFEMVYAFVARRVPDRAAVEDLTSDVFHRALANLKQFEWRGVPFGAWLLKIAANAVIDRAKRGGRELAFDDPPEISAKPRVEQAAELAALFRLVNELPDDQRQVVVMRFAEEKSIREIALHLKRSEGAVKQLQFRGLENLRARVEGEQSRKPQKTRKYPKDSKQHD